MSKLAVRFKRPIAFMLTIMLTVMLFPVVGTVDSALGCHLVRIEVYPETANILIGDSIPYTSEAFDNYGHSMGDVTADTSFSIQSGASGYWTDNVYTSEHCGTWEVTGEYQSFVDTVCLTVEQRSGNISGVVFNDINGNGVRDGEPGLEGVEVRLDGGSPVPTDSEGNYSFTDVATGVHSVEATAPAGYIGMTSNPVTVTVAAGGTVTADDIGFRGKADLSIEKTDNPDPIIAGNNLTYTITVTNHGPSKANGVVVKDTLPPGVTLVSADGGVYTPPEITWNIGDLDAGGEVILTVVVTIDREIEQPTIENIATVSGNEYDPDDTNNTATAETVIPVVDYIIIEPEFESVTAGDSLSYTAEAFDEYGTSLGDVTSATVFSIEPGAGGGWLDSDTYESEIAGNWTVTGNYYGKEAYAALIIKSGPHSGFVFDIIYSPQTAGVPFSITITAVDDFGNTVASYGGAADLSDDTGTVESVVTGGPATESFVAGVWTGEVAIATAWTDDTVEAADGGITGESNEFDVNPEEPGIDIEKHTNGYDADEPTGPEVVAGDPVQWSYTVTNTGNVTLYNIVVTDDTGFVVPFPVDTLLPGESDTAVVNGTAQLGQYANVGHVTANSPLGTVVSDDDPSYYFGVPSGPAVSLDLTPDGDYVTIGNPFTVVVTVYDSEGRVAEGYTGTVHFSSSDGGAGLPADYTFTPADAGVHVFPGGVTLAATGNQTVTATDTEDGSLTDTETFEGWDPYEIDYIVISPGSATIIAGQTQDYTVEAYNQYGYPLGDATSGTTFDIVEPGAGGNWFANTYTSQNPGTWTVMATFQGKEDTAELTVTRGPVEYIVISPHNVAINAGDTQSYTAEAFDEEDNSLGDVTPGTIFSTVPAAGGGWLGNVYTSEKAGSWVVTGTYGTLSDTDLLIVKSGPHTGFAFDTIPSPQIANIPFSMTITAVDDYGNTVSTYVGTAALADLSGTATPTTTTPFIGGIWTGDVTIGTAYSDDVCEATDTVDSEITGTSNEFDVEPGATVSGVVFNDIDRDGEQDGGEPGIPGVTVELGKGDDVRTTTTAGDGSYSFDDVAPGSYRVVETNPAGYVSTTPDEVHINVVAAEDKRVDFGDVERGPEDPTTINGNVFNDVDGDGKWDDDEPGIPDVTVTLDDGTSTVTDSFGWYTFDVYAGVHKVVETDPAGYISTTPNEVHVSVTLDESKRVDFGDAPDESEFAVIHGTVFDDVDGNGEWDDGELGIPGVTITLDGEIPATTDEYGRYMFRLGAASVHTVVETDPVGYRSTTPNEVHVDVALGESHTVNFGDASTDSDFAIIHGIVFDDVNGNGEWNDNEPGIVDVTVTLDGEIPTTTDEYGRYMFRLGFASVHTVIETDPNGYTSTTPNEVDVDVTIGGSYQVNFGDQVPPPPPPGPLSYIVISPDTASVVAGDTQSFTIEAFDEDGTILGDVTAATAFSIESSAGGSWIDNEYTTEYAGEWTVTGTYEGKSDTAVLSVTAGSHFGFHFARINSPQTAGVPFAVTITAVDQYGNVVHDYSGTAALSDLSGTIGPTTTGNFSSGVWTGDVTIATAYLADIISAVDTVDNSITGASNVFNVVAGTGTIVDAEFFTVDFLGEITTVPIADNGALMSTLEAPSPDGSHLIVIKQGTIVTNAGNVVTLIEITEADNPGLPDNTVLLGNPYNFQPTGSRFSIPAEITLGYDVNEIPQNTVSVALSYYADGLGWTELIPPSGVVAELSKETGLADHFTIFAVLARTASGSEPSIDQAVAEFLLNDLVITPSVSEIWEFLKFVVTTGEEAAITVEVTNIGGESGSYTAFLKLDGTIVATQKVSLDPGQTETITFDVGPNEPGTYQVEIGGLTGEFESSVWINWGLILGLPAGLILLILILWYLRKRQRAQAG